MGREALVTVVLFEPVIRRMGRAVSDSSVEVGGKLLGRVAGRHGRIVIQVETFIDSGPGVDTSSGHLFPDGEYQEAIYRVVQRFDPEISHLGSWHSHHPNGLRRLSGGDIRGYAESVNDHRYDLDQFLVLLATGICRDAGDLSYYLFARGSDNFRELDVRCIELVSRQHPVEALLCSAESQSAFQSGLGRRDGPPAEQRPVSSSGGVDLQMLRAADNRWLNRQGFQDLHVLRDNQTGAVFWRWAMRGAKNITCQYVHPSEVSRTSTTEAVLEARLKGMLIERERVALDDQRFEVITGILGRWSRPIPRGR